MKTSQFDDLRHHVKDLRHHEPRPADEELGGLPGAARVLDKCRATLLDVQGEYQFGCPFDRAFARSAGINLDDFKEMVATGASDEDVAEWLRLRAHHPAKVT